MPQPSIFSITPLTLWYSGYWHKKLCKRSRKICLKWSNVSLGVTVMTAILARSDYQLIKIQWFAKQIPGGSCLSQKKNGRLEDLP